MDILSIISVAFITLLIYSLIATIAYIVSGEQENVVIYFGLGIVGLLLAGIVKVIRKITHSFKYHIGKYSIFEEIDTGKRYKCKPKYVTDIGWLSAYKLIKRYATKNECKDIPTFSDEVMQESRKNCDNCRHYDACDCDYPYTDIKCKHTDEGMIIEFDKFEKE